MIKPEMVPDEVVVALTTAISETDATWGEAIAAALNAWPGVKSEWATDWSNNPYNNIILPLPQETRDDE